MGEAVEASAASPTQAGDSRARATPPASADRPPRSRVLVPAVDGFRGLAALSVLLYHVTYGSGLPPLGTGFLRNVFISGYMGVDFFFVISGFVLFLPTVIGSGRFGSRRAYAIRRAARIMPAYYVALTAATLLFPLLTVDATALPYNSLKGALSFLLHLTFLQHTVGLGLGYPEGFLVQGVVWTLSLEVTFYLVLPLVAAWYFRHPFVGFVLALAGGLVWKMVAVNAAFSVPGLPATDDPAALRLLLVTQFPTYLGHFAMGMTAAWLFVRLRSTAPRWLPWLAVVVQAVAAVAIVWGMRAAGIRDVQATAGTYDHWTATTPVALAFALLMLATVLAPRWAQWPVNNRPARRFGDISYGVYLWHLLVIGFGLTTLNFAPDATTTAFLRMLALTLAAGLTLAWASFVLVERPAIRWARRRSRAIEAREVGRAQRAGEVEVGAVSAPAAF